MNPWQRWLKQPQRTFLRRALFQIHLWTGLIIGLYVVAVCVSGSAIVFRSEILDRYAPGEQKVVATGALLSKEDIKAAAVKLHPGYVVTFVFPKGDDAPTEIWMDRDGDQAQLLFNPYTGADMGNARPAILKWVAWFGQLHGNLLLGGEGLWWNGVGGLLLAAVCVSGIVIWWPGISQWKRGLFVRGGVGWKRLNFDLHSAVGFWSMLIILMWALTGAYFVFPDPVREAIKQDHPHRKACASPSTGGRRKHFTGSSARRASDKRASSPAPTAPAPAPTTGQKILRSFSYMHYGNFAGWKVKAVWFALGLLPPLLLLSGFIMWWNRKITPRLRRTRANSAELKPDAVTAD